MELEKYRSFLPAKLPVAECLLERPFLVEPERVRRIHPAQFAIGDPAGGLVPARGTEEPILYVRQQLAALYGSRATLTLRALGRGSEAVIELPYEAC